MAETTVSVEQVTDALHDVIDPELGYNIVDLGLVYGVEVVNDALKVTMTMTTPGCPAQDYIMNGV
ncbi:MAG TPA: iron-sulfur cluster assembly protein, partial [Burkholderiales bacterium]|nr:iron-sulfur cluster assembly protein [Burkholderiales bacterium]